MRLGAAERELLAVVERVGAGALLVHRRSRGAQRRRRRARAEDLGLEARLDELARAVREREHLVHRRAVRRARPRVAVAAVGERAGDVEARARRAAGDAGDAVRADARAVVAGVDLDQDPQPAARAGHGPAERDRPLDAVAADGQRAGVVQRAQPLGLAARRPDRAGDEHVVDAGAHERLGHADRAGRHAVRAGGDLAVGHGGGAVGLHVRAQRDLAPPELRGHRLEVGLEHGQVDEQAGCVEPLRQPRRHQLGGRGLGVQGRVVAQHGASLALRGARVNAPFVGCRPRRRRASLARRELTDYVPAGIVRAQRGAAGAGALGLLAAGLVPYADPGFRPGAATLAAGAVGVLAFGAGLEAVERWLVRRPQPFTSPAEVAADDAIRAQSIHAVAGAGLALLLLFCCGVALLLQAADATVLRTTMAVVAAACLVLSLVVCRDIGAESWRVRRPGRAGGAAPA